MQKVFSFLVLTIYRVITFFLAPIALIFLVYKKRFDRPYGKRVFELLGYNHVSFKNSIWFHTVSVGEAIAAKPIIEQFVKRHPKLNIVVTTTTTSGAMQIENIKGITHLYCPLDSYFAVRRFFKSIKPRFLFIMETELWPNILAEAKKRKTKVIVFNARMNDATYKTHKKWNFINFPLIFEKLNMVIAQSKEDASKFINLGLTKEQIFIANSLKYDLAPRENIFLKGKQFKKDHNFNLVLGAISTHDSEEQMILEVFFALKQTFSELKLVLVPRHKSGINLSIKFLESINEKYDKKSDITNNYKLTSDIILGDTFGEIEYYIGLCDLIFMGGSLINIGGHNPLEAAYFSIPTITGPYYNNFKEQFNNLIDHDAAFLAPDYKRLFTLLNKLLKDKETLFATGMRAFEIQQQGRGASAKTLELFEKALKKN